MCIRDSSWSIETSLNMHKYTYSILHKLVFRSFEYEYVKICLKLWEIFKEKIHSQKAKLKEVKGIKKSRRKSPLLQGARQESGFPRFQFEYKFVFDKSNIQSRLPNYSYVLNYIFQRLLPHISALYHYCRYVFIWLAERGLQHAVAYNVNYSI